MNLGPTINSSLTEKASDLSADGRELFFCREAPGQAIDIFVCTWTGSAWGAPVNLGSAVNSSGNDWGPSLSADGTMLYFASDRPGGQGSYDLYSVRRDGGVWQVPLNLGPAVNGPGGELGPDIGPDDDLLFFSRGWPEPSPTNEDIYYSRKVAGQWTQAQPWERNTAYLEDNANLSADGTRLYFTAIYPEGLGFFDIYYSNLVAGIWQPAVNLGPAVNTVHHDANPSIAADGITLHFTRQDPAGFGGFDLYVASGASGYCAAQTSPLGCLYCFGDGSGTPCPCANHSVPGSGSGCASSLGWGGRLSAGGQASVAGDTLVLLGSGMPDSAALFFQGTLQANSGFGTAFGDGLRCVGGSATRLGTKTNAGGASQYPGSGDLPVHVRGNVPAGAVRTYQCWYRNAASFCTGATYNLTNGLYLWWAP